MVLVCLGSVFGVVMRVAWADICTTHNTRMYTFQELVLSPNSAVEEHVETITDCV